MAWKIKGTEFKIPNITNESETWMAYEGDIHFMWADRLYYLPKDWVEEFTEMPPEPGMGEPWQDVDGDIWFKADSTDPYSGWYLLIEGNLIKAAGTWQRIWADHGPLKPMHAAEF